MAALEVLKSKGLLMVQSERSIEELMNQDYEEVEFVFTKGWKSHLGR